MKEEQVLNNEQITREKVLEAIEQNIQKNKKISDDVNKIIYAEIEE